MDVYDFLYVLGEIDEDFIEEFLALTKTEPCKTDESGYKNVEHGFLDKKWTLSRYQAVFI